MRIVLSLSTITAGAALLLFACGAMAHGSVAMEDDMCKLRVGRYIMHFTGYQPDTVSGPKEFCEDIPEPAHTVIVLDYLDEALRDLPTEVRIIRDNDGNEQDLDALTVFHMPAQKHITGSLSLETKLDAGKYVGLVTVGGQEKSVARFPFTVGRKSHFWQIMSAVVVLGAIGLYYFGVRQRRRQRTPA